jgi:cellulose synthase/poly-beta-1,6-N-acetylglucosamine synthase-like glycosyltransferase
VVLFSLALVVILAMLAWAVVLFVRGQRARLWAPEPTPDSAEQFMWVFLVPALNEEITIRDSVQRLFAIDVPRRMIIVIDDGSEDRTPEILEEIAHPDLYVLRRDAPNARQGKAAALNNAYRMLGRLLGDTDPSEVVVVVVDADGRLHPWAPAYAAAHFADPAVGGVQSLVRIYNRGRLLTRMQDIEFGVYGYLYQAGRNGWGTASMGGNGQFNRLSALDDIATEQGPWRDRLTEDQDLGLRLLAAGWEGRQDLHAVVDQQGLSRLRPLFRQRTRWSQGNLQAMALIGAVWRARTRLFSRIETIAYLLMPFWQGLIGVTLVAAITLAATGEASFWGDSAWWQLLFFYLLAFGGTVLGCVASRADEGARGWIAGLLWGHVYAFYTWLLWPVLLRASVRQLTSRQNWSKTEREPVTASPHEIRGAGALPMLDPHPPGSS